MSQMTVRNIPEEHYAALKRVAAANDRSAEAEVRLAIARHIGALGGEGLGSKLQAKYSGAIEQDFRFERDQSASAPASFE